MPRLIGPDFIGIQVADLDAARTFYTQVVGLTAAPNGPPGAVVFDTKPIMLGHGIAIWFGCDDADALHDHLASRDVPIAFPPKDGPFGRYFAFQDPFGYTITAHTLQETA